MGSEAQDQESGERVVLAMRPHPIVLSGSLGFAAFVALVVFLLIHNNELSVRTDLEIAAGGVVVALLSAVPSLVRLWRSSVVVTDRRVLVTTGAVRRHTLEIPRSAVAAAAVEQTMGGRLLGYGTVHITSDSGHDDRLPPVADPEALRKALAGTGRRSSRRPT